MCPKSGYIAGWFFPPGTYRLSTLREAAALGLGLDFPPLPTHKSGGRSRSRPGQSADWPARGRWRKPTPGLDGERTADYTLAPRGEHPTRRAFFSGSMVVCHSTDSLFGGIRGGAPNKWNFAVKIPYLLGQRHLRFRCPSRQNSAP